MNKEEEFKNRDLSKAINFNELYIFYSPKISRHIYLRIRQVEETNDLTSEVFLRTWQYLKKGQKIKNIKPFLYKIADNLIVDYIRSNKYQANLEDDSDLEKIEIHNVSNDVSQNLDNFINTQEISQALDNLNEKYKKLLIMKFIDELEIDEICQILNKSRGAINVAIHRALKTLKENLESEKNERKL
ncbi:MAG TPA: RNA polymerase sigma factor [Candidatus Paceibacterota bacterium]|jgi:RNA polymerase sigma-70 factor (ECF subfamily)|nr:RNA polymerase sigma factor [Candidatus Paceibacterota bacterium]